MRKGQKMSEEQRCRCSVAQMGHAVSEETKKKISGSKIGGHHTEESKHKIGVSITGEGNPFYGKTHSKESRNKMSDSLKGRVCPLKGKHHSDETKKKLSEANTGFKLSELEHHHVKYEEIHGVDEVVLLTRSEHTKLHRRLRKEGKCNVPVPELTRISHLALLRRQRLKRNEQI